MMRALVTVGGEAVYSDGKMVVVLTAEPEPTPPPPAQIPQGKYVPLNVPLRRTIVRKHR